MTSTAKLCQATTKRGQPCQSPAGADGFCFWHSPARAAQRAAARSKGGKARHGRAITYLPAEETEISLKSAEDVLALIERAANDALKLERSLSRSRTLGSLAAVALKAVEVTELEARIAALETLLTNKGENENEREP